MGKFQVEHAQETSCSSMWPLLMGPFLMRACMHAGAGCALVRGNAVLRAAHSLLIDCLTA